MLQVEIFELVASALCIAHLRLEHAKSRNVVEFERRILRRRADFKAGLGDTAADRVREHEEFRNFILRGLLLYISKLRGVKVAGALVATRRERPRRIRRSRIARSLAQAQADLSDEADPDGEGLEQEERQMILNIFDFVETPVREIMTPRVDMCAVEVGTPLEELVKVLNTERHSRLPVYKETVDNIVGILSNRDFLEWFTEHRDEPFDIMKLVMPPVFVPYHKKIDDMLTELRKTGNQLAIVVDEYGGTAGLVTLEDILEEIVGEIKDEDDVDEDEDVQRLKDGRFILDPVITLSDLEYKLGVELEAPENSHVETLSGLIQATLGIIPSPGAEVTIKGYTFRVLKMDGTRMEKVLMILPGKAKVKSGKGVPRTQAFKVV